MTDNTILYSIVFITLTILLLIAGVVITIFMSNKQRILQEMKITQLQLDYEKELRTVQHEVQEDMLTNISRDLHDNIGQLLTVVHLQLEMNKMSKPEMNPVLAPIHESLQSAITQVRLLGRTLSADFLAQKGLNHTIGVELERLQQIFTHFAIHWQHDNTEPQLEKDQQLMAYRMFQEVINNILKHANAQNITVNLQGSGSFMLQVSDDGGGFDVQEQLAEGNGAGLRNMVRRAALANLICNISSSRGKGSTFTLEQKQ